MAGEASSLQDKEGWAGGGWVPAFLCTSCWWHRGPVLSYESPCGPQQPPSRQDPRPCAVTGVSRILSSAVSGRGASPWARVLAGCPPSASPHPGTTACRGLCKLPSPLWGLALLPPSNVRAAAARRAVILPAPVHHVAPTLPVVEYVWLPEVSFLWEEQEPWEASVGHRAPPSP